MIADLLPTEEQRQIEDSIGAFFRERLPVERLQRVEARKSSAEDSLWKDIKDLGIFAIGLPESQGGVGLGLPEEVIVSRLAGQYLVSPVLLASMLATHLASLDGNIEVLTRLIAGESRAAFANSLANAEVHLIDADKADFIVVEQDGYLDLIEKSRFTYSRDVQSLDESIALKRACIPNVIVRHSRRRNRKLTSRASLLCAAYLVGICDATCAMAVDYAKTRQQFGSPIGSFQAIKHMCADMAVRSEASRSQTLWAALADDKGEIAAARLVASSSALANARANIQVHGAIGFTSELIAHFYLKRAHLFSSLNWDVRANEMSVLNLAYEPKAVTCQ